MTQKTTPGTLQVAPGAPLARLGDICLFSYRAIQIMLKTKVMGVKSKLRMTTAAVERVFAEIWAMIPRTSVTTVTVMPLSCARLKNAAPSIEKELRLKPDRIQYMMRIPALVFGKRPILAMMAMIIHDGK